MTKPGEVIPLQQHVVCVGCGYDLYQQPIDGVCPECGTPVQRSRVSLPLDSDLTWQGQIERGLKLSVAAAAGWLACSVMAAITWEWPPAVSVLLIVALATLAAEFWSRRLLWATPSGCEPLVSRSTRLIARTFDWLAALGLLVLIAAAYVGVEKTVGEVLAIVGCVFLMLAVGRLPGFCSLLRQIGREIGSERLPREIGKLLAVRMLIESAFFVWLLFGQLSVLIDPHLWTDGMAMLAWLLALVFAGVQAFVIGSQYDLWQRVQEVHRFEQEAERAANAPR